MTSQPTLPVLFMAFIMSVPMHVAAQDNWTHFRGSNLDAVAAQTKVPPAWNENEKWRTAIPGKGHSSPVVYGDQVWLTTATADGKELSAICADFATGKIIRNIRVFTPAETSGKHSINTWASPTPCIEKDFVYVHFGSSGTACLRTSDGSIVWTRTNLKCKHVQGPGSSPLLYKNLIILHYEGTDVRFIVALDKATGKEVWRTDRPEEPYQPLTQIGKKAYVTPLIINVKGRDLMISVGSAACFAYDPLTGREIWRIVRGAESTVPMPVFENGLLYFYTGYMVDEASPKYTELIAADPDGEGDITATNILWKKRDDQATNQISSPVIRNGLIYTVNTRNQMMCIDAGTGLEIWTQRQTANFNASPVYADGRIWFFNIKGEVIAVKEGRKYEVDARFQMDSGIWATPAFLRNSVVIRTEGYLCRIK